MNIPAVSEKQIWTLNVLIPQGIAGPQTLSETSIALLNNNFKKKKKKKTFNHIGFGGGMVLMMNSSENNPTKFS